MGTEIDDYSMDRGKLFKKRTLVLFLLEMFFVLLLVSRLYFLQVIEADKYAALADENRLGNRLIVPKRGIITDRFGHVLASNVQNFRVLLIREQMVDDLDTVLANFSRLIPLSLSEIERIHKDAKRNRAFIPIQIKENLSWEDMAKVQMNLPDLPGIIIDEGFSRKYPYTSVTHVVGYVGPIVDNDTGNDHDPLLETPGFRIGKMGVEAFYEKELRGIAGNRKVETNAIGRIIREISRVPAQNGQKIELSIDLRLQEYISQLFSHHVGAAVVINIKNGEIMAMVSEPSFDANLFNFGLSNDDWDTIRKNPFAPMTNKAISGLYSPGSTFKMIVALSALEANVVSKDETVDCKGYVNYKGHTIYCWKRSGHGPMNVYDAIKHSCDSYFYDIAVRAGIDRISDMAFQFGLGNLTGITLPNEKPGLIPTKEWKLVNGNSQWQTGDTINTGIGQGSVLVTPLQLAVMTARIANRGLKVEPTIIKGGNKNKTWKRIPRLSASNLSLIREAMTAVVNEKGGSAFNAKLILDNIKMAGKTGTSQVKHLARRMRTEQLPYKDRDHALFVGYAPTANPKYAVAVVVEHGGSGSGVAAPLVKDIMEKTLELDPANMKQTSVILK